MTGEAGPADDALAQGGQRGFLALRDRAHAFLTGHGSAAEADVLAHVYGGPTPAALAARLAAPLLGDPRLERNAAGAWTLRAAVPSAVSAATTSRPLTALAIATTGSNPARGRIVRLVALHVMGESIVERFSTTLRPGQAGDARGRVPRYVAARLGLEPNLLDDLPPFEAVLDDLLIFLGARPIVAQDASLTWAFLRAEARRCGGTLVEPGLIDANELGSRVLALSTKPTLGLLAAHLGIGTVRIGQPEEEARVLALVVPRLLALAQAQHIDVLATAGAATALRRSSTAEALPDEPGVYVLRDEQQTPLYVGKARRLRSRVAAYVHRPLGATRRLEGLVGTVEAVEPTVAATDLDALVLEAREIRRLQPRFNTARQQATPRLWIRLPPLPAPRRGKRQLAARRLEASRGPVAVAEGEFVGPFRTETTAEQVRALARAVFDLDRLRGADLAAYEARLAEAWAFLHGQRDEAERSARTRSLALLRQVLAFDVEALLLPADPHHARFAVVRSTPFGVEALLIDRGLFAAYATDREDDAAALAGALLSTQAPRSETSDAAVVVRWLGAQRPPALVVHLPDEPQAAREAIEDATEAVRTAAYAAAAAASATAALALAARLAEP
jgi:DNA polymerase III epsilon subunit-like protein